MAKVDERLRAEALRRKGWSIRDIAKEVRVSKSSASIWCRDIELTDRQKRTILRRATAGGLRGRLLGSATNHRRKMEKIAAHEKEGKGYVQALSKRELLLIGAAIYWGEGSKKSHLGFINSDADMVVFMYQWFQLALGVKKQDFMPRIIINALHTSRAEVIRQYWARLLGLPISQFRKTTFIKRPNTKRYSNHDRYFGLLTLRVRNSTDLKYRILGLIEGIKYSKFP
jgi:hypothetical protein